MAKMFEKVTVTTWRQARPAHVDAYQWMDLYHDLLSPVRKTRTSSGYDFHAPYGFTLEPGEIILIPTGYKLFMEDNEELLLFPRGGLGFKYFARLANTIGKVDSDYYNNSDNEGHIMVKLRNEGDKSLTIGKGESFVQGTIYNFVICEGDSFSNGAERKGGFGSTSN